MKNVCNKCFTKYCILLFIIIIIAYLHVTTDKIAANVVIAMKNSSELKNYLKQVAQSLDQISNNMQDESHDKILQQMHDKMAEVLKATESGNTTIVHFMSAKSLPEELIQTHAKQPKQRFTGTGAQNYRCPYCPNLYEDTDHQTEHLFFKHRKELQETVNIT